MSIGSLVLLALIVAPAAAQVRSVPDHPGQFGRLNVSMPRRTWTPTAAEAQVMKGQLDSLVAVFRRSPLLAEPRGFATVGSETVEEDHLPESHPGWQPVRGYLLIIPLLYYRQCDTCPVLKSGEGHGAQIGINSMSLVMPGSGVGGCGGPLVFEEPREVARVGGYPLYNTGALLIAARDVPPFVRISRSEWIDAQINQTKNARGCLRPDPQRAAWYDSIRASWTPDERAMEAWTRVGESPRGVPFQLLGLPNTRSGRAYVRVNPALFDSTIARTAIQTILVTVASRADPRRFPRGARRPMPCSEPIARDPDTRMDALAIHESIWCNVDYAAVRALMR